MKTNLDGLFKTNKDMEKDGIWLTIKDDVGFLVRRFGGANASKVKQAMAKHYKPYTRQVESGVLSAEKEHEILVKAFVDASLVDWKGIEIDGEVKEYTPALAIDFFVALPDLFTSVYEYAAESNSFKVELGNS